MQLPEDAPAYCVSAVMPGGSDEYLVLGDFFMRAYYSVFSVSADGSNFTVGLAPSV